MDDTINNTNLWGGEVHCLKIDGIGSVRWVQPGEYYGKFD